MGFTYNRLGVMAEAFGSSLKKQIENPEYTKAMMNKIDSISPGFSTKANLGIAAGIIGGGVIGLSNSDDHPIIGTAVGAGVGYTATSVAAGIACAKKLRV